MHIRWKEETTVFIATFIVIAIIIKFVFNPATVQLLLTSAALAVINALSRILGKKLYTKIYTTLIVQPQKITRKLLTKKKKG